MPSELTTLEASRQMAVLEQVLKERSVSIKVLPDDVVGTLVRVGLINELDGEIVPSIAALHYSELLETV